jgi:hypothetical protein
MKDAGRRRGAPPQAMPRLTCHLPLVKETGLGWLLILLIRREAIRPRGINQHLKLVWSENGAPLAHDRLIQDLPQGIFLHQDGPNPTLLSPGAIRSKERQMKELSDYLFHTVRTQELCMRL